MKALIDNTSLHRISKILNSEKQHTTIQGIDAMALFQFAEHILFTENIEVNGFEIPEVRTRSAEIIDLMYSRGYIAGNGGESMLSMVDFSTEEYAKACEAAAPGIIKDIVTLFDIFQDKQKIQVYARLITESARPIGMTSAPIERWIGGTSTTLDRTSIKQAALSEKALGAFDYTISSSEALFAQLTDLASRIEGDRHEASLVLGIFFRTAINQTLAEQRRAYYSPAPQRARIISETDHLFRHALTQEIQKIASAADAKRVQELCNIFEADESLPLPMFAIHFLRRAKVSKPIEILDNARKLRDSPDVKAVRKWLNRWEKAHHSFDLNEKEKAKLELQQISKDLQLSSERPNALLSILRFEWVMTPEGFVKIKPDTPKIAEGLFGVLSRFARRKIFLSPLAQELAFDDRLTRDVIAMLGLAIVRT